MILETLLAAVMAASPGDRVIGWTGSGTVVGKGYEPAHEELRTVGKQAHTVDVPECWQLDLVQYRVFHGGACVDKATWDRAKLGDRYATGRLNP